MTCQIHLISSCFLKGKLVNSKRRLWTVFNLKFSLIFFDSVCQVEDRGLDELVLDEAIDCQLIEQLRDEVLPFSGEIPHQFILNVVVLLNKGSIHSATAANPGCETEMTLREEFAKTCFETLLQFSLLDDNANKDSTSIQLTNSVNEGGVAGQLAITALLHRFEEVLKKFNDDERQSGKCPLPRYRLSEISFVIKATHIILISMKKAPPSKGELCHSNIFKAFFSHLCFFVVGKTAWEQLIRLYPYLVDCTTTSSAEVSRSLREALLQYCDLLQPPANLIQLNGSNIATNGSHC